MAATSLLALLDDIASVLDDVSVMTKAAAKKTAGVLGDDLALNAEQVTGVRVKRELPVVWAVAKGSTLNKLILVPAALLISALASWLITPLLMVGGLFLCYEGFEKLAHKLLHSQAEDDSHKMDLKRAAADPGVDMVAFEKRKIKGAIRTDFILSAEIIAITLGTVATATFLTQVAVLTIIAAVATVGIYGLVAAIVKLDDIGAYLLRQSGNQVSDRILRGVGGAILMAAPYMMKGLSIIGMAAMFLVGGGILTHGIPVVHDLIHDWTSGAGGLLAVITPVLLNALTGIVAGAVTLGVVTLIKPVWQAFKS